MPAIDRDNDAMHKTAILAENRLNIGANSCGVKSHKDAFLSIEWSGFVGTSICPMSRSFLFTPFFFIFET